MCSGWVGGGGREGGTKAGAAGYGAGVNTRCGHPRQDWGKCGHKVRPHP